jgi:hypothetical protein
MFRAATTPPISFLVMWPNFRLLEQLSNSPLPHILSEGTLRSSVSRPVSSNEEANGHITSSLVN